MVGSRGIHDPLLFAFALIFAEPEGGNIFALTRTLNEKNLTEVILRYIFIASYYSRAILSQTSLNFHVTYTVGLFKFCAIVLMNNSSKAPIGKAVFTLGTRALVPGHQNTIVLRSDTGYSKDPSTI